MPKSNDRKNIGVSVVENKDESMLFEISYYSQEPGDLPSIAEALKKKSKDLKRRLESSESFYFQKRSSLFPDVWQIIGDDSPVKDKSCIKCVIVPAKPTLSMDTSSNNLPSDRRASILDASDSSSTINEGNEQCNLSGNSNYQDFGSQRDNDLEPNSSAAFHSIPLSHQSGIAKESVTARCSISQSEERHTVSITPEAYNLLMSEDSFTNNATDYTTSINGNCRDADSVVTPQLRHVCLDWKKYQLPQSFGFLDDLLAKKQCLSFNNYSELTRVLVNSITPFTYAPDRYSLEKVATTLLNRYPHLALNSTEESTVRFLKDKMQERLGRLRRKANLQMTRLGGRPRKEIILQNSDVGRGPRVDLQNTAAAVDMVSYLSNVKELLKIFSESGSADAMEILWKETFKGRRYEICTSIVEGSLSVLKTRCPLFRQPKFLTGELDLILGLNTTHSMRERWLHHVPLILEVARNNGGVIAKTLLKSYGSQELQNNFESQSCAAIELLPVLIAGNGKSGDGRRYLIDRRDDATDIRQVIKTKFGKTERKFPYIVKIGETFYIIVDSQVLLMTSTGSMEALVNLLAAYYVFNIEWSPAILPALYFLQRTIMGTPGQLKEEKSYCIFANLIEQEEKKKNET